MKSLTCCSIAIASLFIAANASKAAPVNDSFANAILFSGDSGYHQGSTVASTTEVAEPSNGGSGSIWYKWTSLPYSAVLTVSLKRAAGTGWHYLDVYQANGGANINALTLIGRDSSTTGGSSEIATIRFTASANQLYYIRVVTGSSYNTPGVTEVSLDYSPKDSWSANYQAAANYYSYFASYGDTYSAAAYYSYLKGIGDYNYYAVFGQSAEALYAYYQSFALYNYYILLGRGDSRGAGYNYNINYAFAYYFYFYYKGQTSTAASYYNYFVNQANGAYV